jgi:hypothetical protein
MRRKLFIFALAAICLVFASGVGVGVVGRRALRPVKFQSVLVEELDLTPDQRHKIQQIWNQVAENHSPPSMAEIEKADVERRAAIDQLFTPGQRRQYDQIQKRFEDRIHDLDRNGARVTQAEQQTMQLLTAAQREKYQRLLAGPRHVMFLDYRASTRP